MEGPRLHLLPPDLAHQRLPTPRQLLPAIPPLASASNIISPNCFKSHSLTLPCSSLVLFLSSNIFISSPRRLESEEPAGAGFSRAQELATTGKARSFTQQEPLPGTLARPERAKYRI